MSNLAKNLRDLMQKYALNASELARRTGIGQPVLNRLVNGVTTNPNVDTLSPLASFFSVSINELIGEIALSNNKNKKMNAPTQKSPQQIPLISWHEAIQWNGSKDIKKRHRMIATSKGTSDAAFALQVEDEIDSRFPNGTTLVVEPNKKLKNRDYVIVQKLDHQIASIKRYILDGDTAYLKPIDPDLKTVVLDQDHKILGVVIQSIFDFE